MPDMETRRSGTTLSPSRGVHGESRRHRGKQKRHDTSSGYSSLTDSHENSGPGQRSRGGRSPPPPYIRLYPNTVAIPPDSSGSAGQHSSSDESLTQGRSDRSFHRISRQRRHQPRSQHSRSSLGRGAQLNSCGSTSDSTGHFSNPEAEYESDGHDFHHERSQESHKRRSRSAQHRRQSPRTRITIYEERPTKRVGCIGAPEFLIHENARQSLSTRKIALDGGCVDYLQLPVVTQTHAKESLVKYTKKKFAYGTKAAKKCQILKILPECIFRYILLTLTESRRVEKKTEIYTGKPIDNRKNGTPPNTWDIAVTCPGGFHDETKRLRIPHSSAIKKCTSCGGTGDTKCMTCGGAGHRICDHCHGGGYEETYRYSHGMDNGTYRIPCHHCPGNGRLQCCNCGGRGDIRCDNCNGNKKVVQYDELVVSWKTVQSTFIEGCDGVPKKYLYEPKGAQALFQEGEKLEQIRSEDLLNDEIRSVSKKYLERHNSMNVTKLRQRQIVDMVPINEVQYSYRDEDYQFFLLGLDRRVYAPDYPHKKWWGCCVM